MKSAAFFAALVSLLPAYVAAQAQEYGQCGGIGWSKSFLTNEVAIDTQHEITGGATTCVSGTTCTVLNSYYSQCLPGSAVSSSSSVSVSSHSSSSSSASGTTTSSAPGSTSSSTPTAGNPWTGYQIYLSPYYAAEVAAGAAAITDATLSAKAASVAKIPTFTWLGTFCCYLQGVHQGSHHCNL